MSQKILKTNLRDVTFLVLVSVDSIERVENLSASVNFLLKYFDTNIWVWECGSYNNGFLRKLLKKEVEYRFVKNQDTILHRTYYLNQMTLEVQTPYIAIWDTDVVAHVEQIMETVNLLRSNHADFVFPYNHYLLDTSDILRELYLETGKIQILEENRNKMKEMYPPNPVGGAFFCNREKYIESGLENEKIYGWGHEDGERCMRWDRLQYKIKRVEGPLFHLTHPRGITSHVQHPDQQVIKTKERVFTNRLT